MDASAADPVTDRFAAARSRMVDGQLRPNRVNDPRILAAMRTLPRERFLPASLAPLAYADAEVKLPSGRPMLAPLALARLIQLAAPRAGEQALVVGAGTGYGAAVLAACGVRVSALEQDPALLALARPVLAALAPAVRLIAGPLAAGQAPGAPWDIVLIEGAVDAIPGSIAAQLRQDGGRLVTVLAGRDGMGRAVLAEATALGLAVQPAFDCTAARIPELIAPPQFVF